MHDILRYIKFILDRDWIEENDLSGPNWEKFGISINIEEDDPIRSSFFDVSISPYDFDDRTRYNAIIAIIGENHIIVPSNIMGLFLTNAWCYKIFKACLKVDKLKAFI